MARPDHDYRDHTEGEFLTHADAGRPAAADQEGRTVMGYQNANLVSVLWASLPGNSFKVLVRMALSSSDNARPAHYFAGNGPLLVALGRSEPEPDDDSKEAIAARNANAVALRGAISPLRAEGVISYAVAPTKHRTAEYFIHLGLSGRGLDAGKSCGEAQGNPAAIMTSPQGSPAPIMVSPQGFPAPIEEEVQMRSSDERENNSSYVTTSPAISGEERINSMYSAAMTFLNTLPDLGQSLMTGVPAELSPRERVILAAEMARAERNAS